MANSKLIKSLVAVVFIISHLISYGQTGEKNHYIRYSFTDDNKEVAIHEPDLPEPWLNRLTNDVFHTWITQNGYIESFLVNPALNGLVNPQEVSGHLYLRDRMNNEFVLLNKKGPNTDTWKAFHGHGYTRIETSALEISYTITYFVPRDDNVIVFWMNLRNTSDVRKNLDLFSQVEWNLGDVTKSIVYKGDGRGGSQFNLYKKVTFENDVLFARQLVWKSLGPEGKPWPYTGFMATSMPVRSYETDKEKFLGIAGSFYRPAQVVKGICSNSDFWSENEYPWGVLHNTIELDGGASHEIAIIIGMEREQKAILRLRNKYADLANVRNEYERVNTFYDGYFKNLLRVNTPDKAIDRIINIWTPYQWRNSVTTDLNSGMRGLSFWNYALESGNFGFWGGDAELAVQPNDLTITKESFIRNLSMQFFDARTTRLTASAPAMLYGDVDFKLPVETPYDRFKVSHHHEVYGLYSISLYLRETGDFDFLNEKIPFVLGEEGTVFDHMVKGVDYALNGISLRGLPLVNKGVGDWNDEINRMSKEGKAESVMYGMQLCYLLKEYADIARIAGYEEKAVEWNGKICKNQTGM
jgi:cellobiose phosphorylase